MGPSPIRVARTAQHCWVKERLLIVSAMKKEKIKKRVCSGRMERLCWTNTDRGGEDGPNIVR